MDPDIRTRQCNEREPAFSLRDKSSVRGGWLSSLTYALSAVGMQFTVQEMKLIGRLRKHERQWPRLRWIILAIGLLFTVNLALYGHMLFALVSELQSSKPTSPDTVLAIAIFFPKCLVHVAIAIWAFSKAFTDWHGNVNRMLLLRLLDAQQDPTTDDKDR